jgi:hypothetical protein
MRAARHLRADVPFDHLEENRRKSARLKAAMQTLSSLLSQARPDVVVVVASDQLEAFDFRNLPRLAVYVGEDFWGRSSTTAAAPSSAGPAVTRIKGHPAFGTTVLRGLMARGFDPAFCMDVPNPERGLAHGLVWKAESTIGLSTPIVPLLLNCHHAPQISARRSYEIGRALRQVIDEDESDLRVAVVGTGGLWHTPGAHEAYLDEDFDRAILTRLEAGDIEGMAGFFDNYPVSPEDESQSVAEAGPATTGMTTSSGPQGGTRQVCNWIAAAAIAEGCAWTTVDYVPVYASPIGAGFAYSLGVQHDGSNE